MTLSPDQLLWAYLIQANVGVAPLPAEEYFDETIPSTQFIAADENNAKRMHSSSWPIYASYWPDGPMVNDNIIAVQMYDEELQGTIQRTGVAIGKPLLQVRIRATDYQTGYTKAKAVSDALENIKRTVLVYSDRVQTILGGSPETRVLSSFKRGPLLHLGQDPDDNKKRDHFAINGKLTIL